MWRHYVYLHRKADTGEAFYVGKGSERVRNKDIRHERAFTANRRNQAWQNTVRKHGLVVEIIASCESDEFAQEVERQMIAEIGRRNLGRGPLINFTDGGDGHAGILVSDDLRHKRSENSKGKRSDAWVASMRAARKNGGNGGVVKKGDKLPDWWRDRIAATKNGTDNPMYGKTGARHPMSRKVRERDTGIIYDSVLLAAEAKAVKMKTLYNWLSGHRPNPTSLEFA